MRPSLTSQVRRQYEIIDRALTVRSARSGLIANGLIACSQSRDSASNEVADTIFLGGPILTMDGASDGGTTGCIPGQPGDRLSAIIP